MNSTTYLVLNQGAVTGPYTLEEIHARLSLQKFTGDVFIRDAAQPDSAWTVLDFRPECAVLPPSPQVKAAPAVPPSPPKAVRRGRWMMWTAVISSLLGFLSVQRLEGALRGIETTYGQDIFGLVAYIHDAHVEDPYLLGLVENMLWGAVGAVIFPLVSCGLCLWLAKCWWPKIGTPLGIFLANLLVLSLLLGALPG